MFGKWHRLQSYSAYAIYPFGDMARKQNLFAILVITILLSIVYSNTFHASWHYDDEQGIVKNLNIHIKELSLSEINKTFFASPVPTHGDRVYRPVANLTLALNFYFGKLDVVGYHMVNVLIHIITAVFVFLLVRTTLTLPVFRDRFGQNSYHIALLTGILWATHPIQTQAVTYIIQRMTSMTAMFYIVSLYLYVKARLSTGRRSYVLFILSLLGALLSFGSKENSAVLPITIILYDLLLIQNLDLSKVKEKRSFYIVLFLTPVLPILLYSLFNAFPVDMDLYSRRHFDLEERLLTQARVVIYYITLLLYPSLNRLNIDHDFSLSRSLLDPLTTLLSIIVIVFLLAISVYYLKKRPLISFCILWFFGNLAIESSFIPLELLFEHRLYLPSVGYFLLFSVLIVEAYHYCSKKACLIKAFAVLFVFFLTFQANATYLRNAVWKSELALCSDGIEKSPRKARPYEGVAKALTELGFYRLAIEYNQKAIELNPRNPHPYNSLGMAYHFLGESDKGIEYFKRSISHYMPGSPFLAQPYNNLGVVYSERKLYDEALEAFRKAVRLNGEDPNAYNNLGRLYYLKGEYQKAIAGFKKTIEMDPFYIRGYVNLAIAYKEAGLLEDAEVICGRTLEITPKDIKALMNLVDIYKMQGRREEMFQKLDEIIHYYPEAFIAYNRLGREYFENGAYDKALNALKSSLMIRSNCPETHLNIALVYCYGFNSYRKAREHLECLLKLDPGSAQKEEVTDLATHINRYLSEDNSLSG